MKSKLEHLDSVKAPKRQVPAPNECIVYDTKESGDEAPVMLKLWGMRGTPSLPGSLWLGLVVPD